MGLTRSTGTISNAARRVGFAAGPALVVALAACGDGATEPGPEPPRTPVATVAAGSPAASEGVDAIVQIRLDPAPASPLTVRYSLGPDEDPGTADADAADYEAAGFVSAPAGSTDVEVRIPIRDDADIEPAREVFVLRLDPPAAGAGYALGTTTSTPVVINEGVCDRTPGIREALVIRTLAPSCQGVTVSHLGITTLNLAGFEIPSLRPGDLSGLYNLRNLDLSGVGFTAFPVGAFTDLRSLASLRLRDNGFETLPPDAFEGLVSLTRLDLGDNALVDLGDGAWEDLPALEILELRGNGFTTLRPGALAGLERLEQLNLADNSFETLPEGAFAGLPALRWLYLGNGRIAGLEAGTFEGLEGLESLLLQDAGLETLPAGVFAGLTSLRELRLDRNALESLPDGVFAGLTRLEVLRLYRNRLAALPPAPFEGLAELRILRLELNRLAELPARAFVGLTSLDTLLLADNPGAPFPLRLEVERTDGEAPDAAGPARIALRLPLGAPFRMSIPLAARGGELSADSAVLEAGSEWSDEITVTGGGGTGGGTGGSEAHVVAGPAPAVPAATTGLEVGLGDPLVLFGSGKNRPPVPVREVAPQRLQAGAWATAIDLSAYFRDPEEEALTYTAVVSDSSLAMATVTGDTVILTPIAAGSATATVTAADSAGGVAEISFPLTVRAASPHAFDIDLILLDEVTESQREALEEAVRFWSSILADTELPEVHLGQDTPIGCWDMLSEQRIGTVDDVVFVARIREIDGVGHTLARAGPCGIRSGSALPFLGAVEFDAADLASMEEDGDLKDVEEVFLHEIGHVFGIGTVWLNHGLLRNPSIYNPGADAHFTGPLAIQAFDEKGGLNYDDGEKVPVENESGPGAADSHWRESVLGHELMTPYQAIGERDPLSIITIQSLADLGYTVKAGLAEWYQLPQPDAAARATPARVIPYGDDILRGPVTVVDPDGRVVRIIPN